MEQEHLNFDPEAPRPGPVLAGPAGRRAGGRDARLAPGTRRVLHVDVDAFLASVEQAVHPELRGKPVVVGGDPSSRNLVMSCSYDTRPFGVRPGISLAEAQRRCPRAIFRAGDSQAANRLREELAKLWLQVTPAVEMTSIDDLLVELTGSERLLGDAFGVAVEMRRRAWDELHLPITVGIGRSPLFARLAGKLGKPGGVAELLPGLEQGFLDALPVEHLPGVGHQIGKALAKFGIRTVGELRRLVPRELLFQSFGRDGLVIAERANGVDRRAVDASLILDDDGRLIAKAPKSIRRDSTFEPEEGRPELIEAMLSWIAERAAHRLRSHGLTCGSVELRLRYVPSGLGDPSGASLQRRRKLAAPSDSTAELFEHARAIYRSLPRRRALVKRIGIGLVGLAERSGWQGHLFNDGELLGGPGEDTRPQQTARADRQRELDTAIDVLRAKIGMGAVVRGSSIALKSSHPLERDGFRLRTPSLNQ